MAVPTKICAFEFVSNTTWLFVSETLLLSNFNFFGYMANCSPVSVMPLLFHFKRKRFHNWYVIYDLNILYHLTRGIQYLLSKAFFCGLMYNWEFLFTWVKLITFFTYLNTKFNIDKTTYLHTSWVYITVPWYTAVLTLAENRTKILAIR